MAHYQQGLYDVVIKDHGLDVSKQQKTPYVWFRFLPVKCDGKDIDAQYEREVKLYLTDKTAERNIQRLRDLGFTGNSFKSLEDGSHSFSGVNCQLRCMHDQNGESIYENWEFPAPMVAQSEKKKGMSKKLDALFGKTLKGGSAPAAKEAAPAAAGDDADDDCPF